jgi:hypothetical protein
MIKLYEQYDAELLFEAPGIRNEKDVSVMMGLLDDFSGSGGSGEYDAAGAGDSKSKTFGSRRRSQRGTDASSSDQPKSPSKKARKKSKEAKQTEKTQDCTNPIPAISQIQPSPMVDVLVLSAPCVLLFGSHDVRLHDNRAVECASFHSSVVPTFLWNRKEEGQWGVHCTTQKRYQYQPASMEGTLRHYACKHKRPE